MDIILKGNINELIYDWYKDMVDGDLNSNPFLEIIFFPSHEEFNPIKFKRGILANEYLRLLNETSQMAENSYGFTLSIKGMEKKGGFLIEENMPKMVSEGSQAAFAEK